MFTLVKSQDSPADRNGNIMPIISTGETKGESTSCLSNAPFSILPSGIHTKHSKPAATRNQIKQSIHCYSRGYSTNGSYCKAFTLALNIFCFTARFSKPAYLTASCLQTLGLILYVVFCDFLSHVTTQELFTPLHSNSCELW